MDPDEVAYKKSVRNMSLVLAAIAITIFAALAASPYVFPPANTFQQSASYDSAFGFTLHLRINATAVPQGEGMLVSGWLNGSSGAIDNITASDAWGMAGPGGLWTRPCTNGWPIGVGIMRGHYTQDNATSGTLVPVPQPAVRCPAEAAAPSYFLLDPHSSRALVDLGGTPQYWILQSFFTFNTSQLPVGVYTAVLADEWGDLLTTNFVVS
jgi:hypothetical protein